MLLLPAALSAESHSVFSKYIKVLQGLNCICLGIIRQTETSMFHSRIRNTLLQQILSFRCWTRNGEGLGVCTSSESFLLNNYFDIIPPDAISLWCHNVLIIYKLSLKLSHLHRNTKSNFILSPVMHVGLLEMFMFSITLL